MNKLKSINDKFDTLLKGVELIESGELGEDRKKPSEDQEWENIDDDLNDYLTFLNSETKIKSNPSDGPLFPGDVLLSKNKSDLKVSNDAAKYNKAINGISTAGLKKKRTTKINNGLSHLQKLDLANSQDFAAAKIVELSKKVRELNALLTSTQNKLRIKESELLLLNESKSQSSENPKETVEISDRKINEYEKQIKELTEKYSTTNAKLCDVRNQVQQQKHEIKLFQKALTSEVGDNASLQTVTADGWRGRAQQILSLQQKVNELNERLSQSNIPVVEKSLSAIHLLERAQDKEKISSLTNELEDSKAAINEIKVKYEQCRARVSVLTKELSNNRSKFEAITMKNYDDVKLINTLTARLTSISDKCHEREQALTAKYEEEINNLQTDYREEKLKSDQLKKIVIDRDSRIEKSEAKLNDLNSTRYESRPPSSWTTFQEKSSSIRVPTASALPSTEFERLRLLELVTVLNKRIDEERKVLDKVQDSLRLEKQRCTKLESKCSRLELEKVGKSYRRCQSNISNGSEYSKVEMAAAKDRCTLLEEKVLALESRLERLRQEKEEDSRIYVRMVEEARQAVKDHLRKSILSSNSSLP